MIRTIKELKEIIQNLLDDMKVMGFNSGNGNLVCVSYWIIFESTLTKEEIRDGYPNGVTPTLVISTD